MGIYRIISKLSGNKCWYSEALENSSEWEIEHFRPKGVAKGGDGKFVRVDGYWWLSYHWKNLRLAGSLVNKVRKDRFTKSDETFGKGIFFPLEGGSKIAEPEDMFCDVEKPMLLDPVRLADTILISFDKNGDPFPTYNRDDDILLHSKAELSIKYYGLKHTPLRRGRYRVWEQCENIVEKTNNYIKNNIGDKSKRQDEIDECFYKLAQLSTKKSPYSMVVRSFIKEKLEDKNYSWLKNSLLVMQ